MRCRPNPVLENAYDEKNHYHFAEVHPEDLPHGKPQTGLAAGFPVPLLFPATRLVGREAGQDIAPGQPFFIPTTLTGGEVAFQTKGPATGNDDGSEDPAPTRPQSF